MGGFIDSKFKQPSNLSLVKIAKKIHQKLSGEQKEKIEILEKETYTQLKDLCRV